MIKNNNKKNWYMVKNLMYGKSKTDKDDFFISYWWYMVKIWLRV